MSIFNFSSGPAILPQPVLKQVQAELLDWKGSGISMLEIHHRSAEFMALAQEITQNFRSILQVPDNYKILFMQGGGRGQFAMVPLNLLGDRHKAAYAVTGLWSQLAQQEAQRYCRAEVVTDSLGSDFTRIEPPEDWAYDSDSAYLHYTDNETAHGLEFPEPPLVDENQLLVSDMSSNILSKSIDWERYGLVYACAQKNMGPAGITVVVVREDLLDQALSITPSMYHYQSYARQNSLQNTPPCFIWYVVGLVLDWIKAEGGVAEMERRSIERSQKLYQFIDQSDLFYNSVEVQFRSRMNVVFHLRDESLNSSFVEKSKEAGLLYLKGHSAVGGMRVGLYNPMPLAGVDALINFMKDFQKTS